jgi:hypothetical protein
MTVYARLFWHGCGTAPFKPIQVGQWTNVAADRPWWQLMRTPRAAFVFAGLWAVIGGRGHAVSLGIGVLQLVLAAGYLASAVAQRRREQSGAASRIRRQTEDDGPWCS